MHVKTSFCYTRESAVTEVCNGLSGPWDGGMRPGDGWQRSKGWVESTSGEPSIGEVRGKHLSQGLEDEWLCNGHGRVESLVSLEFTLTGIYWTCLKARYCIRYWVYSNEFTYRLVGESVTQEM